MENEEWICIDDEMPSMERLVLVVNDLHHDQIEVARLIDDSPIFVTGDNTPVFPTHWMLLPKLPEYIEGNK